jgi:hypothetical protein
MLGVEKKQNSQTTAPTPMHTQPPPVSNFNLYRSSKNVQQIPFYLLSVKVVEIPEFADLPMFTDKKKHTHTKRY